MTMQALFARLAELGCTEPALHLTHGDGYSLLHFTAQRAGAEVRGPALFIRAAEAKQRRAPEAAAAFLREKEEAALRLLLGEIEDHKED